VGGDSPQPPSGGAIDTLEAPASGANETPVGPNEELRASVGAGYRPHLDGLRAVAVYLVVLFHAGSDRFNGGYIGVDVFFVLSGYLVTQLLVRDLVGTGTSIRFGRFYSRRFRRLLPAAFVALIVTAFVFTALASPLEVAEAVGSFKAAFLYVTNWYFIDQSAGYFGADLSGNPVLHFWSLAVEEQFYLLWPLILGGLVSVSRRFGARSWSVVRIAVAVGAIASVAWAWALRDVDPNRAYYGTDARAYQLLVGAFIALTPGMVRRLGRGAVVAKVAAVVGLIGLVFVASAWADLDAIERGTVVAVVTALVIAALEAGHGGPAGRMLSAEHVVYLGRISYGTYLWHWPVVIVINRSFALSTLSTIGVTVLLATALAALSFHMLERPIRMSALLDRHRGAVIASGLAISVVAALVLIPAITDPDDSARDVAGPELTTSGLVPVPSDLDWQAIGATLPRLHNCFGEPPDACTVVRGPGAHVLLIGDSHAAMVAPTLTKVAKDQGLTLSVAVHGSCPWQRDLFSRPAGADSALEVCRREKADLYERVLPALAPDVVVAMNLAHEDPTLLGPYLGPDGDILEPGAPTADDWLERTTRDAVDVFRDGGADVVLLEPIPYKSQFNPLECLSEAEVVDECRYVARGGPTTMEEVYRRLDAQADHVWSADLDKLVCPFLPICDPIVNHEVVKLDSTHLTPPFARTLAPALTEYLVRNGIIAAAR
jgi:peptidoglycan/LPS O-acetylase OafA/YrhL